MLFWDDAKVMERSGFGDETFRGDGGSSRRYSKPVSVWSIEFSEVMAHAARGAAREVAKTNAAVKSVFPMRSSFSFVEACP
jgi:hypothetical protein